MTKPIINIKFLADLAQFSSEMQNASREMDKIGRKLQGVGKTLSVGLTAPLTALGVSSVKTFANFEQEMAKVKAISGATGAEFKSLKKNAEDLGAATRFTASQVAALQLNYSKLGFSPDEILNATEATLALAQATGEDLAESATVAASTIQSFQLDSSETARVADVMAKSFSASALDLNKFSTSMSKVAPVANTANQSIEDTTGMLSVLVNAGIEASTAGTGLRNIFLRIAKAGVPLEEALGRIQTSSNKNKTAMELFGEKGATVATVLAENFQQAKAFAVEYRNAGGEAQRMAKIMDDTLSGSLARLRSALEGAAIAFGEEMTPVVRALTDRASELVAEFKALSPETKRVIVSVAAFAAATGPAIVVTGTLIRNVNTLIPLFKGLTLAIASNPIGALAVAVGALAGGVLVANSRLKPLTNATKEFAAVTAKASSSIAKEKVELDKYLRIARNDKLSKEEREKAIKRLNALSPEYLGNLSLETVNTKQAEQATQSYIESLKQKAKVIAAEEKLVEVEKKLLDLTLGQSDAVNPSVWQNLGNAFKSAGQAGAFFAATSETIAENFTKEKTELEKLKTALQGIVDGNEEVADTNNDVYDTLKKIASITKQSELSPYLKSENEQVRKAAQDRLKILKNFTDDTTNSGKVIKGSVQYYEQIIKKLEEKRDRLANTSDEYERYNKLIREAKEKIGQLAKKQQQKIEIATPEIAIPENPLNNFVPDIPQYAVLTEAQRQALENLRETQRKSLESYMLMIDNAEAFNEGFNAIWQNTAQSFAENLGTLLAGFATGNAGINNLASWLLDTIADMAIQLGKLAIGIGTAVLGIKKALQSLNPAVALAAGVGLIALGSFVKTAASNIVNNAGRSGVGQIPALASGGLAMGPTLALVGEYANARSNPEVIAPLNKLQDLIAPGQDIHITLGGSFEVEGTKLRLVLDRTEKKRKRTT